MVVDTFKILRLYRETGKHIHTFDLNIHIPDQIFNKLGVVIPLFGNKFFVFPLEEGLNRA
jgi:hypothetical protein